MNEHQSSYRQIMKATSLFGGVQVFQIIISIVRSKFIAILLGPAGMGIVGLLTTTTNLVSSFTNFGLGTSAVKNVSEANATQDEDKISGVIIIIRRLVWITGLLGAIITLILSPWLSQLTFNNKDYTLAFAWLSITLLTNQLSTGELIILQGLRKLQDLAKANLYGSFVGLIITIPLYYKYGEKGIVPVLIVTAFITLFFSWYFAKKTEIQPVEINTRQTLKEGKSMLIMGFMISLSGIISIASAYVVRIFITRTGSLADVGFYSAGFTIINTYVGMIFTAMGTDYYPRLSLVAKDNALCSQSINQQTEIALLVLAPILIFFLVFVNLAVIILYSSQFLVITGMLYWASLGIFFKAMSWAIAFIFLAKGESKLYFWNEFIGNIITLGIALIGYYMGGLTGLGVAFMVAYVYYLIQVFIIARVKYQFSFTRNTLVIFAIQFFLAMIGFFVVIYFKQAYAYIPGVILIGVSTWYSYRELESRIGIKAIIQAFISKISKKH